MEALRWTMESIFQHSTWQSFGTDCKDLIAMTIESYARPSFAIELESIETLQIYFPDFEIIYIARAQNQILDYLARITSSFYIEYCFIGCYISVC